MCTLHCVQISSPKTKISKCGKNIESVFKTCFVVDIYLSITDLWLWPTILPNFNCGSDKANFTSILDEASNTKVVTWLVSTQLLPNPNHDNCHPAAMITFSYNFVYKQQFSPLELAPEWDKWYFLIARTGLQYGVVFPKTSYKSGNATPYFVFKESLSMESLEPKQ